MIYLLVAFTLFLASFTTLSVRAVRPQLYWAVMAFLFVFSAFRFQVGCDWSGYYYQYEAASFVASNLIANLNEPIWWLVLSSMKEQDIYFPFVNVIAAAIFFGGVHVLARRQPDPLAFLVFLFPILIINMPMSGIRQGAAIGVLCIAFAAFIDRRPLRYLGLVLLAGGLHTSALVFIILAPLATGRISRERLVATGLLAVPGLLFLAGGYAATLASKRYIDTDLDAAGAVFRVGAIFLTGAYFHFAVRRKWEKVYPDEYPLVSIGVIGMLLGVLLLAVSSVIADRYAYYLIPIQAMIFARLPFFAFARNKWQHVTLPYAALLVMFVGWTQASSLFDQCYTPYRTWLFGAPSRVLVQETLYL